jgi:hypothetical protein
MASVLVELSPYRQIPISRTGGCGRLGQDRNRPATPRPRTPFWDGDDRINDSACVGATNIIYLVGWFDRCEWRGVSCPLIGAPRS